MYVLGLTGGIAAGKSTVARLFQTHGAVVVDADALVHDLQKAGTPQTQAIAQKCGPDVLTADGAVDRKALSAALKADPSLLAWLEEVLHPAVRQAEYDALKQAADNGTHLAVLDIPLLFETGAHLLCDSVAVCQAPDVLRKERAFERPAMTEEKWQALAQRRWPTARMYSHADHLIPTYGPLDQTAAAVAGLVRQLSGKTGKKWPQSWSTAE